MFAKTFSNESINVASALWPETNSGKLKKSERANL